MSATSFQSKAKQESAADVFRSRGFCEVDHQLTPLWPGEFRSRQDATLSYEIEWEPKDGDPAGPLWALLRELHAEGTAELIGLAVCLLEAGTTPRRVWREIQKERAK